MKVLESKSTRITVIFVVALASKTLPLSHHETCHCHHIRHSTSLQRFSALISSIFHYVSQLTHLIWVIPLLLEHKLWIICLVTRLTILSQVWKITCILLIPIFMPYCYLYTYLWIWSLMSLYQKSCCVYLHAFLFSHFLPFSCCFLYLINHQSYCSFWFIEAK